MEGQVFLTGASHFSFGFIVGAIVMVVLCRVKKTNLNVQLYSPFSPFIFGALAALPYAFLEQNVCDYSLFLNVFFFYPAIHCSHLMISLLGGLNVVAITCGLIYCFILLRYIFLVKHIRRHGWHGANRKRRG